MVQDTHTPSQSHARLVRHTTHQLPSRVGLKAALYCWQFKLKDIACGMAWWQSRTTRWCGSVGQRNDTLAVPNLASNKSTGWKEYYSL